MVALAACAMGWPTVRGGFVGGDDHRLALDHVLVNRPSLDHAIQLFAITHRDLYQPLPLLSFSAEFLICNWMGWTRRGPEHFAWFFHLNNVWLHAINSVLVWLVIAMLQRRIARPQRVPGGSPEVAERNRTENEKANPHLIATVAALIFAVHPLNTEVVAWVNGRMMLLSTLFALLSLLVMNAWLGTGGNTSPRTERSTKPRRFGLIPIIVALTLCCAISKIRIGLPVLLLIVAWAGRERIATRRFLPVWIACSVITGVFLVVNVQATAAADLFAGGSEHLQGPRLVRVISALAFYFVHYVYPVGLASYYPTPPIVSWTDATTWHSVLITAPLLAALALASWRSRAWRFGTLWFFLTLAATLPFMPARNVLAADRYMYLPIIGLLWPTAVSIHHLWNLTVARTRPWIRRRLAPIAAVVVVLAMIGQCWNVAWYYETPLKKTMRVALLFPDVPRVWERLGWSYHEIGDYERAAELAEKELVHDAPDIRSGAYQLLGMCAFKRGRTEEALRYLHQALEVDPGNALGKYRLATVFDDLGRYDEARTYYEQAVEAAPQNNPTIERLALVCRRVGRHADARRLYEQAIRNNPFEVRAYVALAEMAVEDGNTELLRAARDQLTSLLEHIPDSTQAWVTLGIVEVKLGRNDRAIEIYQRALALDQNNASALINLAELFQNKGDMAGAASLFGRAADQPLTVSQTSAVSDFLLAHGQGSRAEALWDTLLAADPDLTDALLQRAWIRAYRGDLQAASADIAQAAHDAHAATTVLALRAFLALVGGHGEQANALVDSLHGKNEDAVRPRRQLLGALERFDQVLPNNEWTYFLAARLLEFDGNLDAARASLDLAAKFCGSEDCHARVDKMTRRLRESK